MKYVRKVTALVLSIIFCTAIVIGLGVIFSVKNVNVEFIDYTGEHTTEFEKTKKNLDKLKGSGILFLSAGAVEDKISDGSVLAVEGYERIYPCTVNVRIKERVECFTVKSSDLVYVYDEDGIFMRTVRTDGGEYLNPTDSSPDIVVESAMGGSLSAADYVSVAHMFKAFKESFGALRKLVESVTVYVSLNTANIKLRSGISVVVSEWQSNAEDKCATALAVYESLSDKQRTCGIITVADGVAGTRPTARYG